MGVLKSFMGGAAFALGECARMSRTAKAEQASMTPELQCAIDNLTIRAEEGDVAAMAELGNAYFNGTQLRYDPNEACKWWTMAAKAGDVTSMYNLGLLYTGDLSKQVYNDKLAAHWLYRASIHGDKDAEEVLNEKYVYNQLLKKWKRR